MMLVELSRAMFIILESTPLSLAMMPMAVKKKQKLKILWNLMVLIAGFGFWGRLKL